MPDEARSMNDDEPLNEITSPDIVQTIQVALDKTVAKAKAGSAMAPSVSRTRPRTFRRNMMS